jgi:hypothetical protein
LSFPDACIHSAETAVKQHPLYRAAKSGNADAAAALVAATCSEAQTQALAALVHASGAAEPMLVSAHAYESDGVNAIPYTCQPSRACRIAGRQGTGRNHFDRQTPLGQVGPQP